MRNKALNELVETLTLARAQATEAKMDYHYLSELDHMISTAKANIEEEEVKAKKRIITIDLGMLHPYRHHEKRKRKGR